MLKGWDIWYMRPSFFRDGIMGSKWLKTIGKMPDRICLEKTHVWVRILEAEDGLTKDEVYAAMQSENWSPNGEANKLLEGKGLQHTSMSVGDIMVHRETRKAFIVDNMGFYELGG